MARTHTSYGQNGINIKDVQQLTCTYLACGATSTGVEILADNGNLLSLRDGSLSPAGRIDIADGTALSSAIHVGRSDWLFTYSGGSTVYRWTSGSLIDSVPTPDRSIVFAMQLLDTTLFIRTSSGLALVIDLGTMSVDTSLSDVTTLAIAPFSHGLHVIGQGSMTTYSNIDGIYTKIEATLVSFVGSPMSSVSTKNGNLLFIMAVRNDRVFCLYKVSRNTKPTLVDTSIHPFVFLNRGDSITVLSADGVRTFSEGTSSFVAMPLDGKEVYEFWPTFLVDTDSMLTVVGAHSFVGDVSNTIGWQVRSYLPRLPGRELTLMSHGDRVAGIRGGRTKSVVVPGRTVFEWTPIQIRGSCVETNARLSSQGFLEHGEVMSTWFTTNPNITLSHLESNSVSCVTSPTIPDIWTESANGDFYGLAFSFSDSSVYRSKDRGRSWQRYCTSQTTTDLDGYIYARGDTIWIFGIGRSTLDSSIYRTQSCIRVRTLVNGTFSRDTNLCSVSGFRSMKMHQKGLFAIVASNLVSTGYARSFGYFDLAGLTFTTLFSDSNIVLNSFDVVGSYAILSDLDGNVYSYDIGTSDSKLVLIGENLGFDAIEQLRTLNDSTAILVSATTPPSVFAITFQTKTTSVEGDDPYLNLQIASLTDVYPNPSNSEITLRLTIANGWPISDISIVVSSVLGQTMFNQSLSSLTSAVSSGSDLEVKLPCASWPTGSYVVSVRSSRGRHSRVLIKAN